MFIVWQSAVVALAEVSCCFAISGRKSISQMTVGDWNRF